MKKIIWCIIISLLTVQLSYPAQVDTNRVWGVTIDAINNLSAIVTSLSNMYKKPTTRIVFDEWIPATEYQNAVNQISNVSFIMGEILDSYYMPQYTLAQYVARTNEYLNLLGNKVDIWEIGNEINGEWLGTTADVVAKMDTAFKIVKSRDKKTELTLYYNKNCWEKAANEMFYWVNKNVKSFMRTGLDYVFISYYEDDCNNYQPDWQKVFDSLHVLFPNAKIGIGECGTLTASKKASYINRYYKMNITTPNYVGGYFWWYYKQDCVPYTNTLWGVLNSAITNASAPTTQANQISFTSVSSTSVSINWTNGNGSRRAVFLKECNSLTPTITNGMTYTAKSTFGQGTQAGPGWYCVYDGSSIMASGSTIVTGLNPECTYRAMVFEYNGNPGFEGYNTSTATNNPFNTQEPLPVELLSFTSMVERNNVILKWITGSEINNKGFTIEKSISNNETWLESGFVSGAGNSNTPKTYEYADKNLSAGKYKYRLKQTDYNGNFEYHNLTSEVIILPPQKFEMSQNYPNPFNPITKINFSLPVKSFVTLDIFDNLGRKVASVINEEKPEGNYTIDFDAGRLSSGVYFYKMNAGNFTDIKRMLLIK